MPRLVWLLILGLILSTGCGSGDQRSGGGPIRGGPEPVGDLELRFVFPEARLPAGIASLQVLLFDEQGDLVRQETSPRVSQLTLENLSFQTYLVRTLFFDDAGALLGHSDQVVSLRGATVLTVEILLTGPPPGSTVPPSGTEPAQLAFLLHPSEAASNTSQNVQVVALDAMGRVTTAFDGPVTLTLSQGSGVLSGTTTTQAVNGVADLSPLVVGNGPHRLQASAPGLASAESVEFQVADTLPVATSLRFAAAPASGAVGQTLSTVQVEVLDQFGNLLTEATNSITLSGLTLNGATTQSATGGVASFPGLSPTQAGTFQLAATSAGLTEASTPLVIDPLVASSLRFVTVPSLAQDGQPFQVAVEILDQFGARLDAASPVTLSLASGPPDLRLTGTVTRDAVNGLATFDVALADAAGVASLTATSPGAASATSGDITVQLMQGRLYVAQSTPNRVTSYVMGRGAGPLLDGAAPAVTTIDGQSFPTSLFLDTLNDVLWVANSVAGQVDFFRNATTNNGPADGTLVTGSFPRGLAYDPITDRLFVGEQSLAQVDIYDGASQAAPTLRATLGNVNREVRACFYDPAADRLFVGVGQDNGTLAPGFVAVLDNVSALSGNVDFNTAIDRTITAGLQEPQCLFYESHTRRLYVGNDTLAFVPQVAIYDDADTTDNPPRAALLPGDDPNINFGGRVRGVAVDWQRDELYASDDFNGQVKIFANASQMTGTVTTGPVRALTGLADPGGLAIDLTRD